MKSIRVSNYDIFFVGSVRYVHSDREPGGSTSFEFSVSDQSENTLLRQTFYITIIGKFFNNYDM